MLVLSCLVVKDHYLNNNLIKNIKLKNKIERS